MSVSTFASEDFDDNKATDPIDHKRFSSHIKQEKREPLQSFEIQ
jgi:hypothetical protein